MGTRFVTSPNRGYKVIILNFKGRCTPWPPFQISKGVAQLGVHGRQRDRKRRERAEGIREVQGVAVGVHLAKLEQHVTATQAVGVVPRDQLEVVGGGLLRQR